MTASVSSLKKEGKFARKMMWKHNRSEIFHNIYTEAQSFIATFVRIALVGLFLSLFKEATVINWIKQYWVPVLATFVAYKVAGQLIGVVMSAYRDRGRGMINLELSRLVWQKNESVGIGTRVGSPFQQKLRTARRCDYYDIKNVGLWPIEATASVLSSISLIGALVFMNWRICAILIFTASVITMVAAYMSRWVREREKELQEADDKSYEYYPASLSIDSTFLGTSKPLFERAQQLKTKIMSDKVRFHQKALYIMTLVGSLTLIVMGVQLYMTRDTLFRDASLVKIGVMISTALMSISSFVGTVKILFGEQTSIEDVRELQEFLELPDEERNKDNSSFQMSPNDLVQIMAGEFAYPYITGAPHVISNISLEFAPGEAVAIVGANGSGKTTLACLLSNIHRPQKGCVLYGNTSISNYSVRSVLEHALVIPQSGSLPDLPLSESLFGVTDMSVIDMGRYAQAISMSRAREVLNKLPNGIHSQIGTVFTGGVNLSGGEEQRLRLASFFYKALDHKIKVIIADEPSRYLDPETRRKVYSELIALARDQGKIVLVISHDAELAMFDRVVVLDKGRVLADKRGEKIEELVRSISMRLAGDLTA